MKLVKIDFTDIDRGEVLRYACSKETDEINKLLDECIEEMEGNLNSDVVYEDFYMEEKDSEINFSFTKTHSESLAKSFSGCGVGVVFAATIGLGIDRLIEKYNKVSPSKALMFQALGTERIENLCDNFQKYISSQYAGIGLIPVGRFSPGYGDLDLNLQKVILPYLEAEKRIGITLNDSLLMTPSKSVTAFIGLKDIFRTFEVEEQCGHDCHSCSSEDCLYRK
ncbi:MAG: Vitamin B12 dependent methionine synthase activation subunit [Clostridia bacterium]|nr:Vitamin B12 dependent methionine synthase activation subunit [Clostridia bacterium]